MDGASTALTGQIGLIYLGALVYIFVSAIAFTCGFYRLPQRRGAYPPTVTFKHVLGAFLTYILLQILLIPVLAYLWTAADSPEGQDRLHFTELERGWLTLAAIVGSGLGLAAYCFLAVRRVLPVVAGSNGCRVSLRWLKDYFMGWVAWAVSFPLVFCLNQALSLAVKELFHPPEEEQVAVKYLKMTSFDPWLFWTTAFVLVTVVPLMEETLFRGFLLNWFKRFFSLKVAIFCTSIVFASFHFSVSQGWHNIDLLVSLFVLACYLGFIYERQRSIWASVGLHSTFNLISIFMIASQTLIYTQ